MKLVSSLLYDLPNSERYRVIFMQRNLDEVLESQEKMLKRLNRTTAPADQMRKSFTIHLDRLFAWLAQQRHLQVLQVNYNRLLSEPETEIQQVVQFLDSRPEPGQMLSAIDPSLYRNRRSLNNQ